MVEEGVPPPPILATWKTRNPERCAWWRSIFFRPIIFLSGGGKVKRAAAPPTSLWRNPPPPLPLPPSPSPPPGHATPGLIPSILALLILQQGRIYGSEQKTRTEQNVCTVHCIVQDVSVNLLVNHPHRWHHYMTCDKSDRDFKVDEI